MMSTGGEHGRTVHAAGLLTTTTQTVYAWPGLSCSVWIEYEIPFSVRTSFAVAPSATGEPCGLPDCACQLIGTRSTTAGAAPAGAAIATNVTAPSSAAIFRRICP